MAPQLSSSHQNPQPTHISGHSMYPWHSCSDAEGDNEDPKVAATPDEVPSQEPAKVPKISKKTQQAVQNASDGNNLSCIRERDIEEGVSLMNEKLVQEAQTWSCTPETDNRTTWQRAVDTRSSDYHGPRETMNYFGE